MTQLHPSLVELSGELDRLGYKVVPHGDHLCVRLPLFSSVRIRFDGERYRFTPQFGPFGRSGGLLVTSAVAASAVGGLALAVGAAAPTLIAGFLGVVALAHDACRFVITEGALTRLQQTVAISRALPTGTPNRTRSISAA